MTDSSLIIIDDNSQRPNLSQAKDTIRRLLDEGLSVQIVAARLNIDPTRVLAEADEARALQRQQSDNGTKLADYVDRLDEIIDLAHFQCKADPMPSNVYAYTALIETARGVMQDIDGRRDNDKLSDEIFQKVMGPLINETIIGLTQQLAKTKADLLSVLPAEQHNLVTQQLEGVLRGAAAMLADQLGGTKAAIMMVLAGQKNETKQQMPVRKTRPKPMGR